jgi:hypothetical protein
MFCANSLLFKPVLPKKTGCLAKPAQTARQLAIPDLG